MSDSGMSDERMSDYSTLHMDYWSASRTMSDGGVIKISCSVQTVGPQNATTTCRRASYHNYYDGLHNVMSRIQGCLFL